MPLAALTANRFHSPVVRQSIHMASTIKTDPRQVPCGGPAQYSSPYTSMRREYGPADPDISDDAHGRVPFISDYPTPRIAGKPCPRTSAITSPIKARHKPR